MSLIVKQNLIIEDIKDEEGNKLGEIKFNPDDSRIMSRLSKIVNDLNDTIKKIKDIGEISNLSNKKLETIEDFEKESESFKKIYEAFNLQEEANTKAIKDLEEIFGEDTINLFTNGTKDVVTLLPLLEFITPYIKDSSKKRIEKYTKTDTDVME